MKKQITIGLLLLLPMAGSFAEGFHGLDFVPSAPAAGQAGSTAIHMSSNAVVAWASGYSDLHYGAEVDAVWMVPEESLGPADGVAEKIVCLGRGGQITLRFPSDIADGAGPDFAVFENGVGDGFLELAWVEVSSDGTNFVRFPNYSYTASPVGSYGEVNTRVIHGLASKYRLGYGTPFDLDELCSAYNAQLEGNTDFSAAFAQQLTNNFPLLDLNNITHVRLVDIVGDGTAFDSRGEVVYDPYPTVGSAGFDLDAVAVLHPAFVPVPYAQWATNHSASADGQGDADSDGVVDFQEYMMGGDPNLATSAPVPTLGTASNGTDFVVMEYALSRHASGISWIEASGDLSGWTNAIAESTEQWSDPDFTHLKIHLFADVPHQYYRLFFEGQ